MSCTLLRSWLFGFLCLFYGLFLSLICDIFAARLIWRKRYNLNIYKPFIKRKICQEVITTSKEFVRNVEKSSLPPTITSKYCCSACSKRAYKKRQIAKEKEAIRQALARRIPSTKGYLTVKEAVLIYGISKDVLYRMIRQGVIPSHNSGQRQTRLSRQYMDEHFKKKPMRRNSKKETLSFEPKNCYTIGQIAKKFHINEGTVLTHIRRNSIPTRQIGSYVYVPKSEIDKLYKSL